jgi:hypothetical protein
MKQPSRIIGVDFDNTIVGYDSLLHRLAVDRGWIPPGFRKSKKAIRDHLRTLPDGEIEWQRLQAVMYGPAISGAVLFDGVMDFFRRCRRRDVTVFIVSHKTAYSNLLGDGVNFRQAATHFLHEQGFFDPAGAGLTPEHVFYESTRTEKVARIAALGCRDFVDDLEETFLEQTFSSDVNKVLFNPHAEAFAAPDVCSCRTWAEIQELLLP